MRLAVIGNPANRRVALFTAAVSRAGLPAPEIYAWRDVLTAGHVPGPGALVRIDSPGEDAKVDMLLRRLGSSGPSAPAFSAARGAVHEQHQQTAATAIGMAKHGEIAGMAEHGEIVGMAAAYAGLRHALGLIVAGGGELLSQPDDILTMTDKARCHAVLSDAGIPVPPALGPVHDYASLRAAMRDAGWSRVFVKPAYGSSASGVLALAVAGRTAFSGTARRLPASGSATATGRRSPASLHSPPAALRTGRPPRPAPLSETTASEQRSPAALSGTAASEQRSPAALSGTAASDQRSPAALSGTAASDQRSPATAPAGTTAGRQRNAATSAETTASDQRCPATPSPGTAASDQPNPATTLTAGSAGGGRIAATTSVELEGGRLFNSLRVRRYEDEATIAAIIDRLGPEGLHVERWYPKAGLAGRTLDLRVVVIAGRARHIVVRTSRSPMTNLHLGNARGDVAAVRAAAGDRAWRAAMDTCEGVAACFPRTLHVGVDLMFRAGWRDHAVAEVNAFGDLLPGVLAGGLDTYGAQVAALTSGWGAHA